jgi:glutamate formiminotransferase/formiminotetrahydrofolate cyclodeaminase
MLIECIPNISEGRDPAVIDRICEAICSYDSVRLLHRDVGFDAHRTVLTIVADEPKSLKAAVLSMYEIALSSLDMRRHQGAHPRIGAVDVCPFVSLDDESKAQALKLARAVGEEVGRAGIPVFLYEQSADRDYRRRLFDIRRGEYEGLPEKLGDPLWAPDFGPCQVHPGFGATVIGVRELLVAFNISLGTEDSGIASRIAAEFRALRKLRPRFHAARAIGWYMPSYQAAQVSINLVDTKVLSLIECYDAVRDIAGRYNVKLLGSELIGLCPEALLSSAEIADVPAYLGLSLYQPFEPEKRILERRIAATLRRPS